MAERTNLPVTDFDPEMQASGPVDLVWQMQMRREEFSKSEQKLADMILSGLSTTLAEGIVELSTRAEVSPPTVTRFCRRLGCRSFADFKVRLAQSRFTPPRYLSQPQGPSQPSEIAEKIFSGIQDALHNQFSGIDYGAITRAARMISEASYVLTFGSGGVSSMIAQEAENRLFRLGLAASVMVDHQAQLMRAAAAPKGSVIFAASVSGLNRPLCDALEIAGEYSIPRVVMTRPGTPVSERADVLLVVDMQEGQDILRPTSARYAYLAMLDVLAQLVATYRGAKAVDPMRRIKHNLLIYRDKDDSQPLGD